MGSSNENLRPVRTRGRFPCRVALPGLGGRGCRWPRCVTGHRLLALDSPPAAFVVGLKRPTMNSATASSFASSWTTRARCVARWPMWRGFRRSSPDKIPSTQRLSGPGDYVAASKQGSLACVWGSPRNTLAKGWTPSSGGGPIGDCRPGIEGRGVVPVSLRTPNTPLQPIYLHGRSRVQLGPVRVKYGHRTGEADDLAGMSVEPATRALARSQRRIVLGTYVLRSGYYDAYYGKGLKVRRRIAEDFTKALKRDVIASMARNGLGGGRSKILCRCTWATSTRWRHPWRACRRFLMLWSRRMPVVATWTSPRRRNGFRGGGLELLRIFLQRPKAPETRPPSWVKPPSFRNRYRRVRPIDLKRYC